MMKHSFAINLGAAIVLLVPAVALQGGDAKSLDESLKKTVAVLDELAGIQARIDMQDASAVTELLKVTEAPLGTDAERDQLRDTLREDIGRLQSRLDGAAAELPTVASADEALPATHQNLSAPAESVAKEEHTPAKPEKAIARDARAPRERAAFETHGYVADSGRLVRAYYKQGRYGEALAVIGDATADARSSYWRGRCFEKLGKRDEALVAYRSAADAKDGDTESARAKEALEFLEWQTRFESRRVEAKQP